jgi:hypothetical protein
MAEYSGTTTFSAAPTGNTLVGVPATTTQYQVDAAALVALQQQLASKYVAGRAASLDGTSSLPAPTGVGLEFVIGADGLDDIRFNGVSL